MNKTIHTQENGLPEMLTRKQVADSFGVCKHTIREWELKGYLKGIRFTKRTLRYTKRDVEGLMHRLGVRKGGRQ